MTPAFLLGALLWPAVADRGRDIASAGVHEGSPINAAGQQVLTITLQRVHPQTILDSHEGNLGASAQARKCSSKRGSRSCRNDASERHLICYCCDPSPRKRTKVDCVILGRADSCFPMVGSLPATEIPQRKRRPAEKAQPMTLTVIALGSNLDNPPKQLKEACFRLSRLQGLTGLRVSSVFTSPPMGPQDQPPFFNAVATAYTEEPRYFWLS